MSYPTEFDFMLIKMGDGATTNEAFTQIICGIQSVTVNETAQTQDRFVRDCAKPGKAAKRKVKTTGTQLDITGTGLSNATMVPILHPIVGVSKNYHIEGYKSDGTDTGSLLGTFAGAFVLTASNFSAAQDGASSGNVTLASDGDWTYTAAS